MVSSLAYFFLNLFLLSTCLILINGENSEWYTESKPMARKMQEKVTNFHFYFHDTISGSNPSAIQIAGPTGQGFGATRIADEPLTEGPEPTSKLIGKAQGVYAMAAQQEMGLLMVFSYVFLEGKFNGSTLSVLGRNPIMHPLREMAIVGGTGLFRYARGYAEAKTVSFNAQGDAVVEYHLTVLH